MKIKGTGPRSHKAFVKKNFGDEGLDRVLRSLSEADRAVMGSTVILPSDWVDFEPYINFFHAVARELNNGDESIWFRMGEASAERELSGIYRIFLKLGSPGFIIKQTAAVFKQYYSEGVATSEVLGSNKVRLRITGFEPHHYPIESVIGGWGKKALELSGARDPRVKVISSLKSGGGVIEYEASWS
jgi:hypothetical protein